MKNLDIRVTGKVQGVYFRKYTHEKANELNIKGWVKNMTDGSVEISAEGEERDLEAFVQWCNQGPPKAIVQDVKMVPGHIKNFKQFEIIRD